MITPFISPDTRCKILPLQTSLSCAMVYLTRQVLLESFSLFRKVGIKSILLRVKIFMSENNNKTGIYTLY